VLLAVLATALIVAPVAIHRALFRRRLKRELVTIGSWFARAGLLVLALVLSGSAMLLFDVVLSRAAGRWVGLGCLVVMAIAWWVLPKIVTRWAARHEADDGRA